jgi:tetratricopeptide (TPR) repeat protein
MAGRYEDGLEWVEQSAHEQPRYLPPMRMKLVLYAHLGRIEEAKELLQRVIELAPELTVAGLKQSLPLMDSSELKNIYLEGFRKAGLPEG